MNSRIGLVVGLSVGIVVGLLLAAAALLFVRYRKKNDRFWSGNRRTTSTLPIRARGEDSSNALSDSTAGHESPKLSNSDKHAMLTNVSISGVPKFSFKDLKKATSNFTTEIGQGAFGKVYIAKMSTGATFAIKELAEDSRQGEKEFLSEVLLLGRLHHKNLVNLVGYCTEKGKNLLIYAYMSNGSLFSRLYDQNLEPLSWNTRTSIALDVARGIEYLHDGANPPVLHRDIKASNILLDQSMGARVADFGLSKEEMDNQNVTKVKGTFGYLDPEYVSSRTYTKKSDVYSFGVLLFELVAGRTPQQGLLEYVELAAISMQGNIEWEEIADPRMNGSYDVLEFNEVAALAYKCIRRNPRKRPSMRDIAQTLAGITSQRDKQQHSRASSLATIEGENMELELVEAQNTEVDQQR